MKRNSAARWLRVVAPFPPCTPSHTPPSSTSTCSTRWYLRAAKSHPQPNNITTPVNRLQGHHFTPTNEVFDCTYSKCELRRRHAALFASRAKKPVAFIQVEGCASAGGGGCSCGWGRTTNAVTAGWAWRRRALCFGPSARRAWRSSMNMRSANSLRRICSASQMGRLRLKVQEQQRQCGTNHFHAPRKQQQVVVSRVAAEPQLRKLALQGRIRQQTHLPDAVVQPHPVFQRVLDCQ